MPIRINLLAEKYHEAEERRKDPVKGTVYVGVLLVLCTLGWFASLKANQARLNASHTTFAAELAGLEVDAAEASKQSEGVSVIELRIGDLHRLATNRVLWASIMNSMQEVSIPGVPVTRVSVSQGYELTAPDLTTRPPTPGASIERIKLVIEARDYDHFEAKLYQQFQQKLLNHPVLSQYLSADGVNFGQFSTAQPDKDDSSRSFVVFTMDCNFNPRERK